MLPVFQLLVLCLMLIHLDLRHSVIDLGLKKPPFAWGIITDCVAWFPCKFTTINSSPFATGRFNATVPSVRKHGSSTTISFASPVCNTEGPRVSVDSFGEQLELAGIVVDAADADDDDDGPPRTSRHNKCAAFNYHLTSLRLRLGVGEGVAGV